MMQQKAAQTRTERKEASKGAAKAPARPCRPELEMIEAQQAIGNHGVLQTRLAVGAPGDRYEQEADRVAEAVLRMPEPRLQRQEEPEEEEVVQAQRVGGQITPLVQRQVEEEDEEEEQEAIRASSETGRTPVITPEMSAQIEALRGGGRPLPEPVRAFFEPRFGCDFSRVRIHAGRVAAESAGTLKARAFTIGTNVVFGSGQYAPEAPAGRRLLAHELAHVVQQKGPGLCNVVRRQTPSPEERRRAREGLSDRVLRHLDKALPYSGKRPLVAVIRPKGIEIRFRDGGKIYVDRSEKPLDAYLLKGQIEAHRAELKKREKWYMTVVRWLAPEPSVASLVEYTADWELSDRLFIVRRIAEGASLKSVLAELRSLSEANFKFIVVLSLIHI